MQAVEIVGAGVDGDFDGVTDEMTIGDQTALAVYLAAQPRPVNLLELDDLGLLETPLTSGQGQAIRRGFTVFENVGCNDCHRTQLLINNPIFSEPSQMATHRDAVFPAGQNPLAEFVDPNFPVTFDLTADQPDNVITLPNGQVVHLGSLPARRPGHHPDRGDTGARRGGRRLAPTL